MPRFHLPINHQPAMRVPFPGSSCKNCRFVGYTPSGPICHNRNYQDFMGTDALIDPDTGARVLAAQEYCSDWFEPQ